MTRRIRKGEMRREAIFILFGHLEYIVEGAYQLEE
jgi:hypothetical protein